MPDYYDAAQRHLDDANHLLTEARLPNADQLFGLSAECSLKAVMLSLGMSMKNGRPSDRKHGHINVLWDEFITFANGKGEARYADALGAAVNPFLNWDIGQRYEHGSAIKMQIVSDHKSAAEIVFGCLTQAVVDGVVR